jgi:GT2 family glycosyltransferase
MSDTATLMMVTYNRLELTKQTLDNIFKNTTRKYNLVIVDNKSYDDTVEFLKNLHKIAPENLQNFSYHLNDENKGIAIARNQALKMANLLGTSWFCTIDNDVLVPHNWLTECIDVLQSNPRYGMIGVNMEGKEYELVTGAGKTFQRKPAGNLGTACMVFPLSLHKMLGFFNTDYKKYAHEDADFGMRARAAGYQLGYIKTMGQHIGEGANDIGEYREFKNQYHKENLATFHHNARMYMTQQKSIFIPYRDE